jgi:riboflavin synthase|tara:strand:- start:7570 stop:8211 length:642 start_codon:yes stop_codon:yes gene_type:complete
MFSGIVKGVGEVLRITQDSRDKKIVFSYKNIEGFNFKIGDSISINGVCLTVVDIQGLSFSADISSETNKVSTFSNICIGDKVNIEPSIRLGDSLDGHFLLGHVDGVAVINSIKSKGSSSIITIETLPFMMPYIVRKGSVGVDGVSLTVNSVVKNIFDLNIVPYTMKNTIMSDYLVGDKVNIEIDVIARYIEKQLSSRFDSMDLKELKRNGYTD